MVGGKVYERVRIKRVRNKTEIYQKSKVILVKDKGCVDEIFHRETT